MTNATYSIPTTIQEAQGLLAAINLPTLTQEMLQAIGRKEGSEFKEALVAVANQHPNAEARLAYLKTVITACSPVTRDVIAKLGFEAPSIGTLIDLSKQEGKVFAGAIRGMAATNADAGSLAAAQAYLRRVLTPICNTAAAGVANAPTPPASPPPPAVAPHVQAPSAQRMPASGLHNPERRPSPASTPNNVAHLPARRDNQAAAATGEAEGNGRRFVSFHLYGGKAALCFSPNTTRKGGFPTVQIDAAPAIKEKTYDWDKKTVFQLTVAELSLVFGVLFGFTPRIELSGHGESNEKSFSIEDQGSKYFMSMRVRGGGVLALPVLPKDTFTIMAMLFSQMKANAPDLSDAQLMALARRVCEKSNQAATPGRAAANG